MVVGVLESLVDVDVSDSAVRCSYFGHVTAEYVGQGLVLERSAGIGRCEVSFEDELLRGGVEINLRGKKIIYRILDAARIFGALCRLYVRRKDSSR